MSRLAGPEPHVAADAGHRDPPPRMGFFTDTSICIGCKACEVACKEWNSVPDDGYTLLGLSYDNTGALGASTWRHVAFIEQAKPAGRQSVPLVDQPTDVGTVAASVTTAQPGDVLGLTDGSVLSADGLATELPGETTPGDPRTDLRWLMSSDVCKHCTHAGCLDVCPTGSLFRTEFGTVVVQEDICNGCGYCVPACPYGVIERRQGDGRAWKCTLCYDRISDGRTPACAQACPTQSIQFGPLEELRERARHRVDQLVEAGVADARLYGDDPNDGVGGAGAFFLLLDAPEVYGFPPDPVVPTVAVMSMWRAAGVAASVFAAVGAASFWGTRR
jgi:formate dehydrogenase iron-sulfur subunit